MTLRKKLICAFLLLAVVPLAGVTIYSYNSSIAAFRKAVAAESEALAEEMGGRMDSVRRDLAGRVERLGRFPFRRLMAAGGQSGDPRSMPLMADLMAEMGDAARLFEAIEFRPAAPGARPAGPAPPSVAGAPPSPPVVDFEPDRLVIRLYPEGARGAAAGARPAASAGPAERLQRADPLAGGFGAVVRIDGETLGTVEARVSPQRVFREVLARTRRRQGEVPFVIDKSGKLHSVDPADQARLEALGLGADAREPAGAVRGAAAGDWVVVTRKDPVSEATFGIARPIGSGLREIRRTAMRNLGLGLGMVLLALAGIVPLAGRMTRHLGTLAEGAGRLARGDLDARVPVESRDEIGRLAETFNRMARDLKENQKRMVEQERLRKELEMSRRIQEEMLPRRPLRTGIVEAKGVSIPAREVGGDFFNYFPLPGDDVAVLVGDVSGKGVAAALMMANLQATLQARLPLAPDLAQLAARLDREIEANTPPEVYLTLFMGVLNTRDNSLRYVSAGHYTQYVLRRAGGIERLESTGRPLGLLPDGNYAERRVALAEGDALFMYTDGLVEAEDEGGNEFGCERLEELLGGKCGGGINEILGCIETRLRQHRGRLEAADDATMLVVKIGTA